MVAAIWKETLVDVFCELCIKEVEKNNRLSTHLNTEGWTNVLTGFHKETGKSYTKKQFKNKWDALKDVWKLWKELKGKETGLGWDHRLHTIDAFDEWWRAKINDCIGVVDGVHIPASIPPQDQIPYIGRKGIPTQNVMAACDFNMQFIFAYAGWEESAHDTRVFQSVLRDPKWEFPKPPEGKYYVVDAGYPQVKGFLGPYKGPKQHFQEYRGREPKNENEVFNQAHSSLRGVIERTFGAWKKKWHILRNMEGYSFKKQVQIVVATMTLHNYIRRHANHDRDFDIDEDPVGISRDGTGTDETHDENNGHVAQEMEIIRKEIAQSLIRARGNRNFYCYSINMNY